MLWIGLWSKLGMGLGLGSGLWLGLGLNLGFVWVWFRISVGFVLGLCWVEG